jgi:hypothetical protein
MAFLISRELGRPPRAHQLHGQRLVIGRDGCAGLVLANSAVSRRHALLEQSEDIWTVEDLDSTNGIWVNDERVRSAELRHHDEIRIGRFRLLFLDEMRMTPVELGAVLNMPEARTTGPVPEMKTTYVPPKLQQTQAAAELAKEEATLVRQGMNGACWRPGGDSLRIGHGCEVPLPRKLLQGVAAELRWDGTKHALHRLSIRTQVLVNGVSVKQATLRHGDRVEIQGVTFRFVHQPRPVVPSSAMDTIPMELVVPTGAQRRQRKRPA